MSEDKPVVEEGKDKTTESVPYARFREVLEQKKAAEAKLTEVANKVEADKKAAEEKRLKDANEYSALTQRIEAERAAEKSKIQSMIKTTYLTYLGAKSGILKPEYVNLFDKPIEIEGLEVKNAADVEKAFNDWKTGNPTLFTDGKPVPPVDNKPVKPVDTIMNVETMDKTSLWALALEERDRNKK